MEQIEEQIREAESVKESEVRLDSTEPLTDMTPIKMQSAGWVYIYDTRTNERSVCNRNNLTAQLKKKRPDGSLVFTTRKPKNSPERGVLKCMLHPDERKPIYDAWRLPVCMKDNLTSLFQVRRHMQKRHKQEWETIREEQAREERERTLKMQEALIKKASK
jgi:hypothetical protein